MLPTRANKMLMPLLSASTALRFAAAPPRHMGLSHGPPQTVEIEQGNFICNTQYRTKGKTFMITLLMVSIQCRASVVGSVTVYI